MLEKNQRESIIRLMHEQVVPAVGCTEPLAVALCVARATELLGQRPEKINVLLSGNMLKNAMGVGIPGTGMIGLPIAIALGAIVGKSAYQLEVIKDLTPATLAEGKAYIKGDHITIGLKNACCDKLYIEVEVSAGGHRAQAVIMHTHTHFTHEEVDGKVLLDKKTEATGDGQSAQSSPLTMRTVWEFATESPLEELEFIREAQRLNIHAAEESLKGNYGHCLGKTIVRPMCHGIFGDTIFSHIIAKTALACDARMGGAMVPVMSNSGSGNQGICATNPVVVFAQENKNTDEELIRALALSHLTVIYIKQSLGPLSALCGCVVASIGASSGIVYLMGGSYERACYAAKNMIAILTGMICDGAKPSCSLKISSGVSVAVLSATMAMEGRHVTAAEGIIDEDIDQCIRNLTHIGKDAMCSTDTMILDIMTHKKH